jgi:hypothetical protein
VRSQLPRAVPNELHIGLISRSHSCKQEYFIEMSGQARDKPAIMLVHEETTIRGSEDDGREDK